MSSLKLSQLSENRLQELLYLELRELEAIEIYELKESQLSQAKILFEELNSREPSTWLRFKSWLQIDDLFKERLFHWNLFLERKLDRSLSDSEISVTIGDKVKSSYAKIPLFVALDNIRSAFNVGSIIRAAECAGLEKVILGGYTPTPENSGFKNSAMGCEKEVAWESQRDLFSYLKQIKEEGVSIVALETVETAPSYKSFLPDLETKTCLILGNEAFGISVSLLQICDHIVKIPCYGNKNSLNVGQAFSVVALDWSERMRENSAT